MPIHKRGDSWEVIVCHGGKRYRRSSRLWDRAAAREVERKLVDDLRALDAGKEPEKTFNAAIDRWAREELPSHKGRRKHVSHAKLVGKYLNHRKLIEGPEIAAHMRADYQAEGLSAATINRRLAFVRRLLSLAYRRWGWLDQPLHQRVQMLSERGARHVYLTPDQVEALADHCDHARDAVLLAAYTGIRRGQLLGLTRENRVGNFIRLGTEGKTGRPQVIPLHPRVQHVQLPLRVTDWTLKHEWNAARRETGLTHVHFHDLRHTIASWLIHSGSDLMVVKDFLGHSSVAVTQRYIHLLTEHLQSAVSRLP